MQIKSLISIVAGSETAKDRRSAIKKSWSPKEKEERRLIARDAQLRLASLIALLDSKSNQAKKSGQWAACG